jgi:hypothetical protein
LVCTQIIAEILLDDTVLIRQYLEFRTLSSGFVFGTVCTLLLPFGITTVSAPLLTT